MNRPPTQALNHREEHMASTRRDFIRRSSAGVAALSSAALWPRLADAQNVIKVGTLNDLSGPMQAFGTNKSRCIQLGVDEVNQAGGLLGKKLELVEYDTQSNNQLYAQYSQQLALRDRVVVVHGGLTSSSREIVRPILRRANTLYFYNMPYEGGVCDRNIFITGSTPDQLLANLVPYCIKRFGKKLYIMGADYNFGHLSAKWTKKIAQENGGQVVETEFFPLDVNQFGPTISKIQRAKPDFIINTFVGPAHASFYGQWHAAGMKKEMGLASQTFGEAGEHLRMPTEVSDGIVVCYMYVDEIPTQTNKAFIERFRKKFGTDYGYLGDLAMSDYQGWWLWAEAVKKAGSFERDKVIAALETGLSIEGPSGKVTIDPATHHCIFNMYLAEVKDRKFHIHQKFENVKPTNTAGQCDLVKNPNTNAQFEPKID
jgi:branched-chain amino acid transport system substrate-binding protein